MSVIITTQEPGTLLIEVQHTRIDGENHILNKIKENGVVTGETRRIILDLGNVGYINSLGITEIINLHRLVTEIAGEKVNFQFQNVGRKVLSILELVELHKIAEITPKEAE